MAWAGRSRGTASTRPRSECPGSPMRVLLVSQEMPPETGWGGIGTYVNTISRALAAKGADVHVLSVVEGQAASRRESAGVTVHRRPLPVVRRPARIAPQAWRRFWLPTA